MCANSKQKKAKTRLKVACTCTICKVHSNLLRVPVMAHQLVAFLLKDSSLFCVVRSYGHVSSSMTEERIRGTNYMPTPKDIYERKSNWRHLFNIG